jgi:amidase
VGGQCRNPYVLDRNPCGSSSGTGAAVSANFAAAGVGTETDGSIVCPSSTCGLVGLKPTVGLVSRAGIVPISHTQDTAGPMARTVADVAALLGGMAGADVRDAATSASADHASADYTQFLNANGLRGARIGVARNLAGFSAKVDHLFDEAVAAMKSAGAVIVDPADFPSQGKLDEPELEVLLCELKADLADYLATRAGTVPVKNLEEVIAFNESHRDRELRWFGQELFLQAQSKGDLKSGAYVEALAKCRRLSRDEGLDQILLAAKLEALVAPTGAPAWTTDLINGDHYVGGSSTPAAVAGYPSLTVPMGFIGGLPVGISFIGAAWSEPTLIALGYSFEQLVRQRKPPRFLPTAEM